MSTTRRIMSIISVGGPPPVLPQGGFLYGDVLVYDGGVINQAPVLIPGAAEWLIGGLDEEFAEETQIIRFAENDPGNIAFDYTGLVSAGDVGMMASSGTTVMVGLHNAVGELWTSPIAPLLAFADAGEPGGVGQAVQGLRYANGTYVVCYTADVPTQAVVANSTDNGDTWSSQVLSTYGARDVTFDGTRWIVVGWYDSGGVQGWMQSTTDLDTFADVATSGLPTDGQFRKIVYGDGAYWLTTFNALYKSTDYINWGEVPPVINPWADICVGADGSVFAVDSAGILYKSVSRVLTQVIVIGADTYPVYNIAANTDTSLMVAPIVNSTSFTTIDLSNTIPPQYVTFPTPLTLHSFMWHANDLYCVGGTTVYKSTDYGLTFTTVGPTPGSYPLGAHTLLDLNGVLYFFGLTSTYSSVDRGANWGDLGAGPYSSAACKLNGIAYNFEWLSNQEVAIMDTLDFSVLNSSGTINLSYDDISDPITVLNEGVLLGAANDTLFFILYQIYEDVNENEVERLWIYTSTDAGVTWVEKMNAIDPGYAITALSSAGELNGQLAFISTDLLAGGLVGTTDGSTLSLIDAAVIPSARNHVTTKLGIFTAATHNSQFFTDPVVLYNIPTNHPALPVIPGISTLFLNSDASWTSVARIDDTHAIIAYQDWDNGARGDAVIVTTSGSDIIAVGTPVNFNTGWSLYINVVVLSPTEAIVVYRDGNNSDQGTACLLNISGTTLTTNGAPVVFNPGATDPKTVQLDSTRVIAAYFDATISVTGTVQVLSTTPGITFGSPFTFNNALTHQISQCAIDSSRTIVAYNNSGGSGTGEARIISISGTTASAPSAAVQFTSSIVMNTSCVVLDGTTAMIIYQDNTATYPGYAVIVTFSGTAITAVGTPVMFETRDYQYPGQAIAMDADRVLVVYSTGNSFVGASRILTRSGMTLTYSAAAEFEPREAGDFGLAKLDATHAIVTNYSESDLWYGSARVLEVPLP